MLAHYVAGAPLHAGVRELVDALEGRVALAVASNTSADLVRRALDAVGLSALGVVVSGQDLGQPKPAPDVYLAACRALGVAPADAIAFEDSPMGVQSALAAGLFVVGRARAAGRGPRRGRGARRARVPGRGDRRGLIGSPGAGLDRTDVLSFLPAPGDRRRGPSPVRRAALPQPLLVPGRRVRAGRPRRAGRGAGPCRARDHGPPGPVRRGPVLRRRGGRWAAPGHRDRDRAGRRRAGGPGRDRGAGEARVEAGAASAGGPGAAPRPGGPPRPPSPGSRPAARPPRGPQGGPPGDRRGPARAAPRAAGAGRDRLEEPVPAGVAGEPGGHEGRPEVHAGAARGARGGPRRAVGVPARGAGPATPGGGPRGRAGRGGAVRGAVRSGTGSAAVHRPAAVRRRAAGRPAPGSSSSSRTTSCPTTTGSHRRRRAWPPSWGCRSWSRTTSTTRSPRAASCRTC